MGAQNRANMLYKTDCASHLMHLHSGTHLHELGEHGDFFIEGLGGDFLLGDAQHSGEEFRDRRADAAVSEHYYRGLALDHADPYFDTPHIEPFILHNRARRFTRAGGLAVSDQSENVLPFVDGELARFLMSLPDRLRASRSLYGEFAKRVYPEVFAELPHAKGMTIDGRDFTNKPISVGGATVVIPSARISLADYEKLLRSPDVLALFSHHLAPGRSLLAALGHSHWRHFELWRDHTWMEQERPSKHRQSRELMARALSFELWPRSSVWSTRQRHDSTRLHRHRVDAEIPSMVRRPRAKSDGKPGLDPFDLPAAVEGAQTGPGRSSARSTRRSTSSIRRRSSCRHDDP